MLLALQMVLQLFLIFESLLANIAVELIDQHFFIVTSSHSLFFLLSIFLCHLFSVLPQTFLLFSSLLSLFLLFLLLLQFFFSLFQHFELLISWISLLHILNQLVNKVIEFFFLLTSLLLVLSFNDSLYLSIRGLVWIVFVSVLELLQSGKASPMRVKSENLFCT